jgi:hypothetical protein
VNRRIVDKDEEYWNAGSAVLSKGCRFMGKGLIDFADIVRRVDESEVVLIVSMALRLLIVELLRTILYTFAYLSAYRWMSPSSLL